VVATTSPDIRMYRLTVFWSPGSIGVE